ncbi:nuclear transport factor 2 family protein [Ktedonospora formicarum]|nr:nuclear transport factor 2 family protein [Ktedonospora formicarum]
MNRQQTEQEIIGLAVTWTAAELRGDTAFIEKTLTDDFVGIGPLGFLLHKQQWLGRHQSGELKYETLDLDEVQVHLYSGVAILTGRHVQNSLVRGQNVKAQLRTTLVFVQQQEAWQLASLHYCSIGQPPTFTPSPQS